MVHSFFLYFLTSGLQFGFKQKMSTTPCTGTVKNIVSRYMHEILLPMLASLMLQKHLSHKILFERLFDRKLPAYLIHFFLAWYKEQRMHLR